MSPHARLSNQNPGWNSIFFQKSFFCVHTLEASISELTGPFVLIFGEQPDTIGGKRFLGSSPTPTPTRDPPGGGGGQGSQNLKMSIQTEIFRIQIWALWWFLVPLVLCMALTNPPEGISVPWTGVEGLERGGQGRIQLDQITEWAFGDLDPGEEIRWQAKPNRCEPVSRALYRLGNYSRTLKQSTKYSFATYEHPQSKSEQLRKSTFWDFSGLFNCPTPPPEEGWGWSMPVMSTFLGFPQRVLKHIRSTAAYSNWARRTMPPKWAPKNMKISKKNSMFCWILTSQPRVATHIW